MKVYDIFEKGNIQYIPRERREIIYKSCDGGDIMTFCLRLIFYWNFTGAGATKKLESGGATKAGAEKVKELELEKKKTMAATSPPQAHREKEKKKTTQKKTKRKKELLLRT